VQESVLPHVLGWPLGNVPRLVRYVARQTIRRRCKSWWDDVTKDGDDIAVSSGGKEVSGATTKVDHFMNRITW
jgi:hypothetical protein